MSQTVTSFFVKISFKYFRSKQWRNVKYTWNLCLLIQKYWLMMAIRSREMKLQHGIRSSLSSSPPTEGAIWREILFAFFGPCFAVSIYAGCLVLLHWIGKISFEYFGSKQWRKCKIYLKSLSSNSKRSREMKITTRDSFVAVVIATDWRCDLAWNCLRIFCSLLRSKHICRMSGTITLNWENFLWIFWVKTMKEM